MHMSILAAAFGLLLVAGHRDGGRPRRRVQAGVEAGGAGALHARPGRAGPLLRGGPARGAGAVGGDDLGPGARRGVRALRGRRIAGDGAGAGGRDREIKTYTARGLDDRRRRRGSTHPARVPRVGAPGVPRAVRRAARRRDVAPDPAAGGAAVPGTASRAASRDLRAPRGVAVRGDRSCCASTGRAALRSGLRDGEPGSRRRSRRRRDRLKKTTRRTSRSAGACAVTTSSTSNGGEATGGTARAAWPRATPSRSWTPVTARR